MPDDTEPLTESELKTLQQGANFVHTAGSFHAGTAWLNEKISLLHKYSHTMYRRIGSSVICMSRKGALCLHKHKGRKIYRF